MLWSKFGFKNYLECVSVCVCVCSWEYVWAPCEQMTPQKSEDSVRWLEVEWQAGIHYYVSAGKQT